MRKITFEHAAIDQVDPLNGLPYAVQQKNEAGEIVTVPLPKLGVSFFIRKMLLSEKAKEIFKTYDAFFLVELALKFPTDMPDGYQVTLLEDHWEKLCALLRSGADVTPQQMAVAYPIIETVLSAEEV